jgi:hypothetical protein
MGFIEGVWIGKKRTKAGISTEQDRPSVIFCARIIGRVRVAEYSSAQSNELCVMPLFG